MATVKELTARVAQLELQLGTSIKTLESLNELLEHVKAGVEAVTPPAPKKSASNNYIVVATLASFKEASALLRDKYNDAKHFVSGCTVCEKK